MNKREFLEELKKKLSGLSQNDVKEHLDFYGEMIDDMIEEGLTEQAAILKIGTVEEVVSQIISDTPLTKIVKERVTTKRKIKVWEIVLLVLGSPLWLSLLIAGFTVAFSLYISLWAVVISLWAVFASFIGAALGSLICGVGFILGGNNITGVFVIGCGIALAGLSILMFFLCKLATKGTAFLTKRAIFGIKNCFIKKEEA